MDNLFLGSIEGDDVQQWFYWNGALFKTPGSLYQFFTRQETKELMNTGEYSKNGYVLNENIVKNNIKFLLFFYHRLIFLKIYLFHTFPLNLQLFFFHQ